MRDPAPYRNARVRRWLMKDFDLFLDQSDPSGMGPGDLGHYAGWLIERGGRPVARAIIRARQRYRQQVPARVRAAGLHRAYRRRR
jgi:hypothetical protein